MYEAAFKNIDDTLWKDAGCSSELDYIEQTSWVLFLKYLETTEDPRWPGHMLIENTYIIFTSEMEAPKEKSMSATRTTIR